jgi:hypothetical protein
MQRNARYYARQKKALIAYLGGRCQKCGSTTALEFDHINGRTWQVTKVASHMRVRRYWQEARAGLLQLLCKADNVTKENQRRARPVGDPESVPAWVTDESEP